MKGILIVLSIILAGCVQGNRGPAGNMGDIGMPGSSCSVQPVASGALITCTDGTFSTILNGIQGPSGSAGMPGTVVTLVQLCPGTPTYPSKFIEYAIRIGTDLYAVYSDHGGFLALIPPGTYYSNGINSTCNFSVDSNGYINY